MIISKVTTDSRELYLIYDEQLFNFKSFVLLATLQTAIFLLFIKKKEWLLTAAIS